MDLKQKTSADLIIEHLIAIDVDGETMEYIIENVGMNRQMLRQLIMGNSDSLINELLQEKTEIRKLILKQINVCSTKC